MESRKNTLKKSKLRANPLPDDYLKVVEDVFTTNFDAALQKLTKIKGARTTFKAIGEIFPDEIVLSVAVIHEGELAATSVYASADFDPQASAPTAQDLLNACVDALGGVYLTLLDPNDPERLAQVADETLSALEAVPFDWSQVTVEKQKLFVKIDKANPSLERLADDWLAKHDPKRAKDEDEEETKVKKKFVTGPKKPGELEEEAGSEDEDSGPTFH